MSDWQTIDSAPRDGSNVLLWTDTRESTDLAVYLAASGEHFAEVQIGFWEDAVDYPMRSEPAGWRTPRIGEPTHWMPLPAPPMEPGIPIHASRDATNDVLDLAIKPDATGKFEGD